MQEKLWAVVQIKAGEPEVVLVFDEKGDAEYFAEELSGEGKCVVVSTSLSRHNEAEESLARIELPEFNSECIECLIMDGHQLSEEKQEAAAKFLEEHRCEIQSGAEKAANAYIKKSLNEYLLNERVILG